MGHMRVHTHKIRTSYLARGLCHKVPTLRGTRDPFWAHQHSSGRGAHPPTKVAHTPRMGPYAYSTASSRTKSMNSKITQTCRYIWDYAQATPPTVLHVLLHFVCFQDQHFVSFFFSYRNCCFWAP